MEGDGKRTGALRKGKVLAQSHPPGDPGTSLKERLFTTKTAEFLTYLLGGIFSMGLGICFKDFPSQSDQEFPRKKEEEALKTERSLTQETYGYTPAA